MLPVGKIIDTGCWCSLGRALAYIPLLTPPCILWLLRTTSLMAATGWKFGRGEQEGRNST